MIKKKLMLNFHLKNHFLENKKKEEVLLEQIIEEDALIIEIENLKMRDVVRIKNSSIKKEEECKINKILNLKDKGHQVYGLYFFLIDVEYN